MALFAQSGQVRFVNKVIESWRWGSIHREVPVYPRWPNEEEEKYFPDWEGGEGVSQPRAREVPSGLDSRRVNKATVSGRRMGGPPLRIQWANRATSSAVANRPAWPATPPSTLAFSSWTSPWMILPRKVLDCESARFCLAPADGCDFRVSRRGVFVPHSLAVGGMFLRCSGGGLYVVLVMPSGPSTSRWQKRSRVSLARRSRA